MSRSYHANRSWRYWAEKGGWTQEEIEEIFDKRQLKRRIKAQRAATDLATSPSADGVPINIVDDRPCLLYPATEEEMRSVLGRVREADLSGVKAVLLGLGHHEQEDVDVGNDCDVVSDPLTGRLSIVLEPGLYAPLVLGTYYGDSGVIELYGYVVAEDYSPPNEYMFYLKYMFLRTLLHEFVHHRQYRTAIARGRLPSRLKERLEADAMETEQRWFDEYAFPVVVDWARRQAADSKREYHAPDHFPQYAQTGIQNQGDESAPITRRGAVLAMAIVAGIAALLLFAELCA